MVGDEPELYSPEWWAWNGPKPCIWEGRPSYWKPGEAWAFIDGRWEAVNSGDVGMNARPVTAAVLEEIFPDTPPLPPDAFRHRPVTTTFVLWDGDPAVIVKTGAWAKAVRRDAVAGWVTVDPSALWFDEPRNVITQAKDDLPSTFGDAAEAMHLLEAERWLELKPPTRHRWGED